MPGVISKSASPNDLYPKHFASETSYAQPIPIADKLNANVIKPSESPKTNDITKKLASDSNKRNTETSSGVVNEQFLRLYQS